MIWQWPLRGLLPSQETFELGHAGSFGVRRRFDVHTGVDLYCQEGQEIVACEEGVVVAIIPFTGPDAESPWWRETHAVLIEGASGVILYGEIDPDVCIGQMIHRGECIGRVLRVLTKDKGLPTTMLHLELYKRGTRDATWWKLDNPQPVQLLNPTLHLILAAE